MDDAPLAGLTIGITAERKAAEQAAMFQTRGAETLQGPSLRIFSLADDEHLREATLELIKQPPDYLLASTGFGMRTWLAAAETWGVRDQLVAALGQARVANRGAKAASANTAAGLVEWWRAPDERFAELVDHVLAEHMRDKRVVLQLHSAGLPDVVPRFRDAGADLIEIDAYRTSLPVDTAPAVALIDAACAGRLAAVTFTTAPALHNLFVIARGAGRADELRAAFNGPVVAACVGPVCAEGAFEEGITSPVVPERARLVPLVQTLTDHLAAQR